MGLAERVDDRFVPASRPSGAGDHRLGACRPDRRQRLHRSLRRWPGGRADRGVGRGASDPVYRSNLRSVSVLFAGWFGPRGLASIVLGLIVVEEAPLLAGRDEVELVVALTVLLSVLLHGLTAAPLSAVYARRVDGMAADTPEKQGTVEAPTHVGSVPPGIQRGG